MGWGAVEPLRSLLIKGGGESQIFTARKAVRNARSSLLRREGLETI